MGKQTFQNINLYHDSKLTLPGARSWQHSRLRAHVIRRTRGMLCLRTDEVGKAGTKAGEWMSECEITYIQSQEEGTSMIYGMSSGIYVYRYIEKRLMKVKIYRECKSIIDYKNKNIHISNRPQDKLI